MSPTDSAPLRIRVTNLDSVHQAQTWRRHGPQEAIDRTVSMIRSALLLSEQIIVDRNQLLDGVVLLALGPEGLRWHLGLPHHAPLPLVVTGSAPPGSPSIDVAEQLAAVTSPTFPSAARAALTAEAEPGSPWEWLLPPMADPGATRLPARHASTPVGRGIDDDLQEARVAWAHAMTRGEVTTAPWTQITQVPAPSPGDRVLVQHPVLTALVDLDEVPTRRGEVLEILAARRAEHGDAECRRAFRWWTRRYYDAICDADDDYRISFRSAGGEAWQEVTPPRTRLAVMRSRLSTREVPPRQEIPFEGEIVDNMRLISPFVFQQLRLTSPRRIHEFWDHPSNRKIWDLALTIRQHISTPWRHRRRTIAWLAVKFTVVLAVALLLGFRDLEILPTDNGWWLAFWAAIAFVIGVPWGTLQELGSMSGYTMTATLRIADDRHDELAPHASSPAPARVGPTGAPQSDPSDASSAGTTNAPAPDPDPAWDEVWRADGFDLTMERLHGGAQHRVSAHGGRPGAVALCRRTRDGEQETLLVRVRRPVVGRELWELPRGFGDPADPDPQHTALREYREETGLSATVTRTLGVIHPDSGLLRAAVHVVQLEDQPAATPRRGDGEVEAHRWCSDQEIRALIRDGEIADGITLSALLLAGLAG
ncbi:NUDIX hydrolase [Brachybacterium epidermidis]|uniref:NUDIX hydrolase n=1 Tax=Brachybacterium epidermidis TaxID=2781983 RepID=UPI00398EEA5B